MRIRSFYHCHSALRWLPPLTEHVTAVREAGLPGDATLSITGPAECAARVIAWAERNWPEAEIAEAPSYPERWEEPTLRLAWRWAVAHPAAAILYCHAKGSGNINPSQDAWRQSMTHQVVGGWRTCVAALEAGKDAAGAHWITPAEFPDWFVGSKMIPFFAGNFWWASAAHLASLPDPVLPDRFQAELWVGRNNPDVLDVYPGFPGYTVETGVMTDLMRPVERAAGTAAVTDLSRVRP